MRFDELIAQLTADAERQQAMVEAADAMRGTAKSDDGLIHVTVDKHACPVEVRLAPRVRREYTTETLGPAIVAVARAAAVDVSTKIAALWRELYPDADAYPVPPVDEEHPPEDDGTITIRARRHDG